MYAAIDMGGTNIRVAVAADLENLQIKSKALFKNNHDFDEYVGKIVEFCNSQGKISAVGISTNGWLNKDKTIVLESSANAPEKIDRPLVKILGRKLNCRVVMENDAVAAAWGEINYGHRNLDEFIYIIWGTGIGGAIASTKKGGMKIKQIYWPKYLESWEHQCGVKAIEKKYGKPVFELSKDEWDAVIAIFIKKLQNFLGKVKTRHLILGGGMGVNKFKEIKFSGLIPATFGEDAGLYGAFALIRQNQK